MGVNRLQHKRIGEMTSYQVGKSNLECESEKSVASMIIIKEPDLEVENGPKKVIGIHRGLTYFCNSLWLACRMHVQTDPKNSTYNAR